MALYAGGLRSYARGGRIAAGGGLFAGGPFAAGLIAGGLFASGLNAAPRPLTWHCFNLSLCTLPDTAIKDICTDFLRLTSKAELTSW